MPPPLALGPSGFAASVARPFMMVTSLMVTVPSMTWLAGMTLLGLISKTRARRLPLIVALPPLVFAMVRLRPLWLAVAWVKLANSPAWLSIWPGVPAKLML